MVYRIPSIASQLDVFGFIRLGNKTKAFFSSNFIECYMYISNAGKFIKLIRYYSWSRSFGNFVLFGLEINEKLDKLELLQSQLRGFR